MSTVLGGASELLVLSREGRDAPPSSMPSLGASSTGSHSSSYSASSSSASFRRFHSSKLSNSSSSASGAGSGVASTSCSCCCSRSASSNAEGSALIHGGGRSDCVEGAGHCSRNHPHGSMTEMPPRS